MAELGTGETICIRASIASQITYASQQNDVALIADLVLINPSEHDIENVDLTLACEPGLVAPKSWKIDRISAGSEVRLRDRRVSLSGALLANMNEKTRAHLTLTVLKGEDVLAVANHDLTGLARNEWGGANHMPELLAAFVMPNDPAITTILKDAGESLRKMGEQPLLDGYQSRSRTRVWQMAAAIWTSVSNRRLVYAEPPASFETEGQKIRTPSEVLDGGLATCLDTAVLFAAALEQAGLYPVIAFTKGHALCGVWLQPQHLPALTEDSCLEIRKHIPPKDLILFETTMVVSEPPSSFSKAIAEGTRRVSEELEYDFVYALDIKQARRQQITPLGSAIKAAQFTGTTEAPVNFAVEAAPSLPGFDFGIDVEKKPDTPDTRLDQWKRKLLDLTKRNRLLNLKPSKTAIRLYCADPAVLEDKLADGKKITVIPQVQMTGGAGERDATLYHGRTGEDFRQKFAEEALERDEIVADLAQTDLDAGLIELYRKAKTDLEEGGANTLYLALGLLKWKQSPQETQTYKAPLILVPVKLERKSAASKVRIIHFDEDAVFNMTLLEMLRQDFELRIPELEGKLPKDDSGIDVSLIWNIVRKAIRDVPGFELVEDVVLSTFSFAKYLMWKDLADRTETLKQSPFVRHLIERPKDPYQNSAAFLHPEQIDEKIKPSELFMPLSADSSQVIAVHASAQTGDFVLEGPPGTGKSQTIANIIAHNLALGRKVVFVSEKMTALDVVYDRLRRQGLGDFCLELHSNKANKREVLDQLNNSWRNRQKKSRAEWEDEAAKVGKLRDTLNGLVTALHKPGPTGIAPRSAIGRAVRWQNEHRLKLDWPDGLAFDRAIDEKGLSELQDIAKRLGQDFGELSERDKAAFSDIQRREWSNFWQNRFVDLCLQLIRAIETINSTTAAFLKETGLPSGDHSFSHLKNLAAFAECLPLAARQNLAFALDSESSVFKATEDALKILDDYMAEKAKLSVQYPDASIPLLPIDDWQARWTDASQALWPIRPLRQHSLTKTIRKTVPLPAAPIPDQDLPVLGIMQALRTRLTEAGHALPTTTGWSDLASDNKNILETLAAGKRLRESVMRLAKTPQDLPVLKAAARALCVDGRELLEAGMPIPQVATAFIDSVRNFDTLLSAYIKEADIDGYSRESFSELHAKARSVIDLQSRINAWCRWQTVKKEAEDRGLDCLVGALENGAVAASESLETFKTAYCAWLARQLIDARDELKTFSAIAHEDKILEFRKLDESLAQLSVDYIRAKLSGEIPDPDGRTRPEGYAVLSKEIQKRARHLPVRELVQTIGDVLTTLTPCLLMSPLSVSQFLPAGGHLFDLVVFDEASQITVWDAVGAIARGKNVIVVGDPKQMPPTNFFDRGAASDDEANDNNNDDLESILDEGLASGVKLHRLTGHYRSRHESLIAFSNHAYYDGQLVTYPCPETKDSAVSLVKVDGVYQRGKGRTNPIEAKAVVEEIVRRLKDPVLSKLTIGVVTLNSEQKRLIDDLLDQERRRDPNLERFFEGKNADDLVAVKNLETVQGHERDVVFLSIGYGPDSPGAKTIPMNFGPLNRKGGERRLNVAITRAKSEMIVFSSFDPSMIDLTRTSAQAIRDLKHYMDFAQRGTVALGESVKSVGGSDQFDSEFEKSVAQALRAKGWTIHTQIGVSKFRIDLGIVHPDAPGRYLAGIECDGAAYHSSPSAKDRDRVRHSILTDLKWRLIRIWSTDYFIDPTYTLDRIDRQLHSMLLLDREETAKRLLEEEKAQEELPAPDDIASEGTATEFQDDGGVGVMQTQAVPVIPREAHVSLSAERFYMPAYAGVIRDYSCDIIDRLGPITFRHLCAKIARAHGFQRTGMQIKSQIWAAISKTRTSHRTPDGQTVFWPDGSSATEYLAYRGLNVSGEQRDWRDVPYPEKLSLAQEIVNTQTDQDKAILMSTRIGLGRLHQTTREELEMLLATVEARQAA